LTSTVSLPVRAKTLNTERVALRTYSSLQGNRQKELMQVKAEIDVKKW